MLSFGDGWRSRPLLVTLAAGAAMGLLLFAAIPLLQSPANWTLALWILATELVAAALLLGLLLRQQLGFRWDNPRENETIDERDTRWTRNTVLTFGIVGLLGLLVLSLSMAPPHGVPWISGQCG